MTDETNVVDTAGVDTSETQVNTTEQQDEQVSTEESTPSETTEDSSAPPKRKGVGKRIDELVRQREEAKREIEYWRSKAIQQPQPETTKAEEAPDPSKFDSYEAYVRAVARWEVRQEVEQRLTKDREERAKAQQQEQYQARLTQAQQTFNEKAESAREKYEDFDDVAFDESLTVTPVMGEAILEADHGAEVLYYLGNNPREATRIARLSPVAQVREIGKLEAKLSQAPAPTHKPSTAPAPIKPVGTKAAAEKAPHEMTPAEFAAWRKKVIAARR